MWTICPSLTFNWQKTPPTTHREPSTFSHCDEKWQRLRVTGGVWIHIGGFIVGCGTVGCGMSPPTLLICPHQPTNVNNGIVPGCSITFNGPHLYKHQRWSVCGVWLGSLVETVIEAGQGKHGGNVAPGALLFVAFTPRLWVCCHLQCLFGLSFVECSSELA